MTGTFKTADTAIAKRLCGAADIGTTDTTKVTPRNYLKNTDFGDVWFVGDYSDKNGDANGGFIAIKLINALSTGGFQIKTNDKSTGEFPFEFTGYYSMSAQDAVPFELYIAAGTAEA